MPESSQTSIRATLGVTALAAIWLAIHQVHENISWFFLSWFILFAATVLASRPILLFWLPLFACTNAIMLSLFSWWFPPHELFIPICGGVASLIAIFMFSMNRTLGTYRKMETREGVVFVGIGNSCLGGVCVGLMFGVPIIVSLLPVWLTSSYFDLPLAFMLCVALPFAGACAGTALGLGFGFVFDIMVALEFRKRPRSTRRGITK